MRLFYPGGSGGSWFAHLIYCISRNDFRPHTGPHYHLAPKNLALKIVNHDDYTLSGMQKNDILFAGNAIYDFYVNLITKFSFIDQGLDQQDHASKMELLSNQVSFLFSWYETLQVTRPTISYDLLWSDEDGFIQQVSSELVPRGLKISCHESLIHAKIAEYKNKNIDPRTSFDNEDSILWLGWCAGYISYFQIFADYPMLEQSNKARLLAQAKDLGIAKASMKYVTKRP